MQSVFDIVTDSKSSTSGREVPVIVTSRSITYTESIVDGDSVSSKSHFADAQTAAMLSIVTLT
jgi:hypothetical protein